MFLIKNVETPLWAKDTMDYLKKMRLCLESKYVNENLHLWIDLIFGCKQQGKLAIESNNSKFFI